MDAINLISPPAPAPEPIKLPLTSGQAPAPAQPEADSNDGVDISLSDSAKQKLVAQPKETAAEQNKQQTEKLKKDEQAGVEPPPSLGKAFYEFDQKQVEKSKAARQESQKEIEKHLNNYLQYTNNYLAKLAYAKTLADQPIILPQPEQPQDIATKLNLFT